jgi:hypothetical protein
MLTDVRLTLTTDDGSTIAMAYTGVAQARTPELMERFRHRELLSYDEFSLHTTPRFETGDERSAWLNGVGAVTNSERTATGGTYHVFAVTRVGRDAGEMNTVTAAPDGGGAPCWPA